MGEGLYVGEGRAGRGGKAVMNSTKEESAASPPVSLPDDPSNIGGFSRCSRWVSGGRGLHVYKKADEWRPKVQGSMPSCYTVSV